MLKATQRGFVLENQVITTLTHRAYNVRKSSKQEDKLNAIDLFVEGLPIQVTIQTWEDQIHLAGLMGKIKWTEQQSKDSKAIVVAFDKSAMACQWPSMIRRMGTAIKKMAKMGVRTHLRISSDKMEFLCNGQWKEVTVK